MERQITSLSSYRDTLVKLIPSEIVAAHMVISGLLPVDRPSSKWLAVASSFVLVILTPIYLKKLYSIKRRSQILFMTGTFIVWMYWMGGPFVYWGLHDPAVGSIILVLWTLLIPLFNLPKRHFIGQEVMVVDTRQNDVYTDNHVCVWVSGMNQYLGEEAVIEKINRRQKTARLNIDNEKYSWSLDWIKPIVQVNGGNDATKS